MGRTSREKWRDRERLFPVVDRKPPTNDTRIAIFLIAALSLIAIGFVVSYAVYRNTTCQEVCYAPEASNPRP